MAESNADALRLIREDCAADARALDGKPFTGKEVGEQFGNMLAMVDALARIIQDEISARSDASSGSEDTRDA